MITALQGLVLAAVGSEQWPLMDVVKALNCLM